MFVMIRKQLEMLGNNFDSEFIAGKILVNSCHDAAASGGIVLLDK